MTYHQRVCDGRSVGDCAFFVQGTCFRLLATVLLSARRSRQGVNLCIRQGCDPWESQGGYVSKLHSHRSVYNIPYSQTNILTNCNDHVYLAGSSLPTIAMARPRVSAWGRFVQGRKISLPLRHPEGFERWAL